MKKIVIVGGGFAGTWAAMAAAAERAKNEANNIEITLVSDKSNLCIKPRLYEGASPDMLVPLQPLMDEIGVTFERASVENVEQEAVVTANRNYPYDRLILCAGSTQRSISTESKDKFGFSVSDYEDSHALDTHLGALDLSNDVDKCIVVIGASFTGLEIATNLRARLGAAAEIILVDPGAYPGQSLGESMREEIASALQISAVTCRMGQRLQSVEPDHAVLESGERIDTRTVINATGFVPAKLIALLNAPTHADGRLAVDDMLRVPNTPGIFAAGDVAMGKADADHFTFMSCQHAMPMGQSAGRNAVRDILARISQVTCRFCIIDGP